MGEIKRIILIIGGFAADSQQTNLTREAAELVTDTQRKKLKDQSDHHHYAPETGL